MSIFSFSPPFPKLKKLWKRWRKRNHTKDKRHPCRLKKGYSIFISVLKRLGGRLSLIKHKRNNPENPKTSRERMQKSLRVGKKQTKIKIVMKKIYFLLSLWFTAGMLSAQVSKTVTVTAGNLSTAFITAERTTVTNLTVTGTIDARDFKFMRDTLIVLSVLDLSEVNIAAYVGTKGTYVSTWDFTAKNYPENEIPQYSFFKDFYNPNTILKTVILPNSITSIGEMAFKKCQNLSGDLNITNSVTNIKSNAFAECTGLKGKLILPTALITIDDYAFSQCGFTGTVICPNSLMSIGQYAFQSCTNITSMKLPSYIKMIKSQAFRNCNKIDSINIPATLDSIQSAAFYNCSAVYSVDNNNPRFSAKDGLLFNKNKTILYYCPTVKSGEYVIPMGVTNIETGAFAYCSRITKLTIPSTVRSINSGAFYYTNNMLDLIVESVMPPTLTIYSTFINMNSNCKLTVPLGSKLLYQAANQWKNFTNIIEKDFSLRSFGINIGKNGGVAYSNLSCYKDTTLTIKKGEPFILKFLPNIGYEVDTLLLNGVNIKSNINNNEYACTISDNSQLKVTFKLSQFAVLIKSAMNGTIDMYYDYGSRPVVKIRPDLNWQIHSVMLNGIEITNDLQDGQYIIPPITDNVILNIAFEYNTPTNIAGTNNIVKIYGNQSNIIIEGTSQGENISIYTVDGVEIINTKSSGEHIIISAIKNRVYLVKTGTKTVKVLL